jgi:hypothetical protein
MAKTIGWKNLKHARGPATRVPTQIDELVAAGPRDRERAYWGLQDPLVGRGKWFAASAPAVSLLLESVARAADPRLLIVLVADIVGGDQLRGWLRAPAAPLTPAEKAVHEAAIEHKGVLLGALRHEAGGVRAAAAMALAMLPELTPESLPLLAVQATTDGDEIGRSGALLALGRLGASDVQAGAAVASSRAAGTPPLVRGAAGLGWLRLDLARRFPEARMQIEDGLSYRGEELPWFKDVAWFHNVPFADAMGRALVALARHRGKDAERELAELILAIGKESGEGTVETQAAKILLDLGGFSGKPADRVALVEELSPEQVAMAKELAATDLLPGGGFCLPASGAVRRRWIGLDPPGPLDRRTDVRGKSVPVWRAWCTRNPAPTDCPSPLDRWQALIEFAATSYPPSARWLSSSELEKELSAAPSGDELFDRAARIADDLAKRIAATFRGRRPVFPPLTTSALLLLPLVRAGRPIEPRWDGLITIDGDPQGRRLLAALPVDRREAVLCNYLEAIGGTLPTRAIDVVDLAPTPRVVEAIERRLDALRGRPAFDADVQKLRDQLATVLRSSSQK